MCRKQYLQGCCMIAFGLGIIIGHCLDSWFLCCFGGVTLILLGFFTMGKR